MKYKYIESLLSEIQQLQLKVENLKENQNVSFSFFKESFQRTQVINRLLHELEFVQIEDMKSQMEKLVQFLSESESAKEEVKATPIDVHRDTETNKGSSDNAELIEPIADVVNLKSESKQETDEKDSSIYDIPTTTTPIVHNNAPITPKQQPPQHLHSMLNNQKETIVDHLNPKNKSLNDVQPNNHILLDSKRSISLNDRFLFQRELFDNNRIAMNDMLTKLQSFSTYDATKNYLKENTNWNFNDETVDKFIQMLKESFR